MKPLHYVQKYHLSKGVNFSHNEFISDLTLDFMTLLEVGKATENVKGYENAVRAIRMKWDGIDKKTLGQLPEKLWKYFYATVVAKLREELFPEAMAYRRKEAEDRKREREERRRMWDYDDGTFWDSFFFGNIFEMFTGMAKPVTSFELLGLAETATEKDVKLSYRSLAKVYHPDKGGNRSKFEEITEAKNKCLIFLNL